MTCQKCNSTRVAYLSAKCSDCCGVELKEKFQDGYMPPDFGVGDGGDYVEIKWCLDCGQMQGEWPLPQTEMEAQVENEDVGNEEEQPTLTSEQLQDAATATGMYDHDDSN